MTASADRAAVRAVLVNVRSERFDVYIGRAHRRRHLPQSVWANPFKIGRDGSRDECIAKYEAWLSSQPELLARLPELEGKVLGCWCKPERCHGDVLLALLDAAIAAAGEPS